MYITVEAEQDRRVLNQVLHGKFELPRNKVDATAVK